MHDNNERIDVHFVSQDVLKKIRECGTSVTYYGGKVLNTCNGPLISPLTCKHNNNNNGNNNRSLRIDDYVKFKLVKSNSCDSRLELTGRVIERRAKLEAKKNEIWENNKKNFNCDLRNCTIDESPSIEITGLEDDCTIIDEDKNVKIDKNNIIKRERPVVIGLEPKKDEQNKINNNLKLDFKLGKINDNRTNLVNKFGSALTRWEINETDWKKNKTDFGKMEFEEFEVLQDSLNSNDK